ncbi:MAG: tryptophan--tRNA ligase [Planctomycetota bacterium]
MRSLSGVQPSGKLHLGNYFGAIRQFVELQEKSEGYYFVANLHALTTNTDPKSVMERTYDVVLDFLALGLDPEKSVLFLQSDVLYHTELAWYLSCQTNMGLLQRCHAYKDKVSRGIVPNHGLFAYPVLMAADIIIYDSDVVPVGEDQRQHIEVARDIALRFNSVYGEVLKVPEPYILENTAVVPGTDGQKMSKSYGNTIEIFAPESQMKKTIMSIVTDSKGVDEPKDPDSNTVFLLYKLLASKEEAETMRERFLAGGYGYGHAKKELLGKVLDSFREARDRRKQLEANMDYVEQILREGAEKARAVAGSVLERIRNAVGIPRLGR